MALRKLSVQHAWPASLPHASSGCAGIMHVTTSVESALRHAHSHRKSGAFLLYIPLSCGQTPFEGCKGAGAQVHCAAEASQTGCPGLLGCPCSCSLSARPAPGRATDTLAVGQGPGDAAGCCPTLLQLPGCWCPGGGPSRDHCCCLRLVGTPGAGAACP